jgi:hypothetical protein
MTTMNFSDLSTRRCSSIIVAFFIENLLPGQYTRPPVANGRLGERSRADRLQEEIHLSL